MMRIARLILHNAYVFAADAIAAEVIIKNDLFLQHHHILFGLIVFIPKVVQAIDLVNLFPATAIKWFHVSREANVIEYTLPIERVSQVAERLFTCIVWQFL